MNRIIPHLALIGFTAFVTGSAFAVVESEPNNTNGTANVIVVPSTSNGTGVTVTGKLREGNVTPSPRDLDQFKFTNSHDFTSFRVKITPSGIDGSQSIRYTIMNSDFEELFTDQFSSNFREHTFLAANGPDYYVVVEDPGNLSSASGEANYSVEIVGIGSNPFVPITETEANNTSSTANNLVVPFETNDTGVTVSGTLRENNQTPNPRDQDFFRFTNTHQFTSMRVKITPGFGGGGQSISYQILDASQSVLFSNNFESGFRENTISSPAPGEAFFVRVYDPGNLSTESGSANYSVEIVGVGGQNPNISTLSTLALSAGPLSPTFASGTTAYTLAVANTVSSTTVTPTTTNSNATVQVNGTTVTSGVASAAVPLAVGANTITVEATAQNGTTVSTYTVTVTRAPAPTSNVSTLNALALSAGPLSPTFASGTTAYTLAVANTVSSTTVTPTTTNSNATVQVNGTTVTSGVASAAVPLAVGVTTINVQVTAQNGTTVSTYTISVTRAALSGSGEGLAKLILSKGRLSSKFATKKLNYKTTIPASRKSIQIQATAVDPTAKIKIAGKKVGSGIFSKPIALNSTKTIIKVAVTAQNGLITTYKITVTRP